MKAKIEEAVEKLIEMAIENDRKDRELAISNMHPLLREAYNTKESEVSNLIISTVEKKSKESLETIIRLSAESTWLFKILQTLHFRTIEMFGDKIKAEEYAMYYMNDTKEKILEIFSEPFDVAENTKYDFVAGREYVLTLETYQTASLIVDFAVKFESLIKKDEAKQKSPSLKDFKHKELERNTKRNRPLIELLSKYNLKQKDLAEILGVVQPLVSGWVTGKREMQLSIEDIEKKILESIKK